MFCCNCRHKLSLFRGRSVPSLWAHVGRPGFIVAVGVGREAGGPGRRATHRATDRTTYRATFRATYRATPPTPLVPHPWADRHLALVFNAWFWGRPDINESCGLGGPLPPQGPLPEGASAPPDPPRYLSWGGSRHPGLIRDNDPRGGPPPPDPPRYLSRGASLQRNRDHTIYNIWARN